jgi:hypothetical protein
VPPASRPGVAEEFHERQTAPLRLRQLAVLTERDEVVYPPGLMVEPDQEAGFFLPTGFR